MSDRLAITPGPAPSVVDAAAQVVAEQTRELRRQGKAAMRRNDPEGVHQMRVATRRLRTALRALRGHLRTPKGVMKDLRWLARHLGAVRDQDVVLALLHGEKLPGAAIAERERLAALIARLEGFAGDPAGLRADHHLAARVLADVSETLGEAVAGADGMTAAAPDADALHTLRIMFKRLRYALDFHAAACGLTYDVERRMARAMQDILGDIHDRDLLLARLAEGKGPFKGPWPAFTVRLESERARLLRRFLRLRREWTERTRPGPTVAPLEPPRFVNLEVQPVTLRLVTGPKHVASYHSRTP